MDKSRNPSSSIRSLSSSASASSSQRPRRRSSSYYRAATGNETTERGSSRSSMLELEFEFEFEETLTSTNAPPSEYDDDDDDDINTNNNQDHKSLRHFLLVCVLGTFDDRIFFSAFVTESSNKTRNRNAMQDTEQILFTRPTTIGVVVVVVVLFCN